MIKNLVRSIIRAVIPEDTEITVSVSRGRRSRTVNVVYGDSFANDSPRRRSMEGN